MNNYFTPGKIGIKQRHVQILSAMDKERQSWFPHWREISDYFLPRRYPYLMSSAESKSVDRRNRKLLNSVSTLAVRTLATGMMSGITSPARPWLKLGLSGFNEDSLPHEAHVWLSDTVDRIRLALSQSNFYNAMGVLYLEWCTFGTASMTIYEDTRDIIRCYNHPLGSFYLSQDDTMRLNRHGLRFSLTVEQAEAKFGYENLCYTTQQLFDAKGASLLTPLEIGHIIEENADDGLSPVPSKYREVYWEIGKSTQDLEAKYLAIRPFYEWPCVIPRWEIYGNDLYGTSPAAEALADVQQLQNMILQRQEGLEKKISPPLIVDAQLQGRPKSLSARGITYAAAHNTNFGAKAAYDTDVPLQEVAQDILELSQHIRTVCHNDLFNMISQLDTVRSATEIDARREEKLIHLGPVLGRFHTEGLDVAIKRVYGIMRRKGLISPPPEGLENIPLEIQYISVLTDAQRASDVSTIERFMGFTGNLAGVYPEVTQIPNVHELVRDYSKGLGLPPQGLYSRAEVEEKISTAQQAQELAQAAAIGNDLASGAKVLSDAQVGPDQNALQALLP